MSSVMPHLNDCTIYVLVRSDQYDGEQVTQGYHAVLDMERTYRIGQGDPKIVMLEALTPKAFNRAMLKMHGKVIYHAYIDSDRKEFGISAVSTTPLTEEQATLLENYRMWKPNNPRPPKSEETCTIATEEKQKLTT